MPSLVSTALVALASTALVQAYVPYQSEYDGLKAREAQPAPEADAIANVKDALYARSEDSHLDNLYPRNIRARHAQIMDDLEILSDVHAREAGLRVRDLDEADALYRVTELARRDPKLYKLYARDHWETGATAGAALLGSAGVLAGGVLGGLGQEAGHLAAEGARGVRKWWNEDGSSTPPPARRSLDDDPELFYEY